ncbi:K02A2.6-like [Cordylochernes scorpioides]|uniref:RNA-directed DNA polymerase n=1 Tax=Cordylochernes scorpioides TaxID=51811 RepID=A0ABY6KYC4_9ARAC|nr:K02A2.6-like [Cordylochernes scorpioides]
MEDQRICIKFCVKNGFKDADFFWMLQTAYGDAVLELVREDRRITVREVAEEAGISFGSTQSIMKDILEVRRLNAVLVPKDSTFDQKNARKESASLNLEARIAEEARKALSKVKVMLTVFFDYQGIVHHEFQQKGSTITADSYLTTQPLCSPTPLQSRFGPLRLLPFCKAKKKLKGRKFQSIEEIKVESKKAMKAIPKTDYQRMWRVFQYLSAPWKTFNISHRVQAVVVEAEWKDWECPPKTRRDTVVLGKFREQIGVELAAKDGELRRVLLVYMVDEVDLGHNLRGLPLMLNLPIRHSERKLPWARQHFASRNFVLQQNHGFQSTIAFCQQPGFLGEDMWPSNSPDLNPLDYSVWRYLEQNVSSSPHKSLESLKKALEREWAKMDVKYQRWSLSPNTCIKEPTLRYVSLINCFLNSIEEIKVESKKAMKAIPKTDYQRCFADWKKRWLKCIAANGDYFERDNLNLADKCKFTDINENLCDQFVSGCFDEATLKRLLSEPFLTFDSAINIANSVEAAKSQVNLMKNPGHDIDKLKARSKNFKFPCKYNNPCKICGKSNHDTKLCKFKNAQCYICNKKGHIAPVCWNKKSAQNSGMNKPNQNKLNTIQCNTLENAPKIMVNVKIEDVDTIMEVDTGADVSVVSKKFFLTNLKNVTLEKYSGHLKSFSGNLIPVFGKCLVNVSYKNYQEKLPLIVTGQFNNQTPLLGRNWIRILKADWPNCVFDICNNINVISNLELFLEVYKRVFENKDLPIQGIKGSISLRPNAKPKFFKFRPVPFSIKEKIDKELDRLEKSQIIEKVNASDWSTPLVTVIKSNGELRLCGDFKNTLNNCIEDEKYPLPTIETMLGNLGGNKIFTKLDLSSAYHQIEMDEASKNLLVVSTHRGLYRYNRLPFGISPASAIFQRCMDSLFHDVPNTVIYLDDIFIGSKDEQEHYRILKMIFDKLKELNFTLNKEKCLFLKKDICFLGHIINEDGVRPDSKKLEALERCKKPFDKTSLKSFLGMLSFYSKYIPNMSTLAGPLYQLLKKDNRWKWSSQCEKAFLNLKLTLLNSQALIHYSMKLPLTLTCDASAYGISGVLCHIVEGEEKPITFVSRTLPSAEVKYSQTEKEALAIVFATSKLRQYLFGRKFVLKSDHKALTTVFGNKRLLPPLIANRLHRWALELSNFDFDIRYTNKDTMLCADAFSRLPLEEINSREDNIDLVTHDISFLNVTPLDHLIIEEETNKDPVLNKLKEYLLEDPQLAKKDETMKPFISKLENFSVLQGCIFVDSRAVIPRTCQDQMLKLLHQSHIGINRMKSLARSSVWWPKMDSQIEEFVKECSPCMHHQTAPPAENTPWPRTNQPWQRVHVDHFYFRGDCYLLVVDANSNWIEVFPVRGTTSQENIKLLRECFARYGLPQCLVSDNGPPFNSIEFKEFLRKNNVYHLTSPAYNPSSNGIAEVSVRIIKKSLEKSLEESPNSNMDCILQNVLFNYRNTPTSLDKPPVERLLSYVPRTFVNCLNSEFIQKTFGRNECGRRHFQVGDKVLFTRVIQNRRKWFKAQVIRRLGYNVYLVKNLKGTFKVHVNQMRTGSDTKYAEDSDWTLDNAGAGPHTPTGTRPSNFHITSA